MRKTMLGFAAATAALAACGNALELAPESWDDQNPFGGEYKDGAYVCATTGVQAFAVSKTVPVSSNIVFTADFTPAGADGTSHKTASVTLNESPTRYWHLALVETPPPDCRHAFELCEMRDGAWLSQEALVREADETKGTWNFGERYALSISLDGKGAEGTVHDAQGKLLFRRRFRLAPGAVGCGRPVLKCHSIRGVYARAAAEWTGEVTPPPVAEEVCTGPFFRVKEGAKGRWSFVSPDGREIFLNGCGTVNPHGDYNAKLGYAPYGRTVRRKYKTTRAWAEATAARLAAWGFNAVAGGAPELTTLGWPNAFILAIGQVMACGDDEYNLLPGDGGPCTAFPNVFSPKFETYCRFVAARTCAPRKNDTRLLGYFIDNELSWWGDARQFTTPPERGLFDAAAKKSPGHSARQALDAFLAERGVASPDAASPEIRRDFIRLIAQRYFSISANAIREADPNHLVLGCRFAGIRSSDPVVWEECGKYCDVLSVNVYPVADLERGEVMNGSGIGAKPIADDLRRLYEHAKKPLIVTEWSFAALDSGLPCTHGAGQRFLTQKERAKAVELFAKTMYALPGVAGYFFFKWSDQPAFGRVSEKSENTNYGLVNADDEAYPDITRTFAAIQNDPARWRAGAVPTGQEPAVQSAAARARSVAVPGAGAAVFVCGEDGTFAASNGLLRLEGKKGSDGVRVGAAGVYSPSLREYASGSPWWSGAAQVADVRDASSDGLAVFDVVFRGETVAGAFEFTERFYLSPGCAFFFVEHRALANVSGKPLPFDQAFFRLLPIDRAQAVAAEDTMLAPPKDGQPTPIPPCLWRPWQSGLWTTPGSHCGVCSPRQTGVKIRFWKDGQRDSLHADAVFTLSEKVTLASGATFEFKSHPFVAGTAGTGGRAAWDRVSPSIFGLNP